MLGFKAPFSNVALDELRWTKTSKVIAISFQNLNNGNFGEKSKFVTSYVNIEAVLGTEKFNERNILFLIFPIKEVRVCIFYWVEKFHTMLFFNRIWNNFHVSKLLSVFFLLFAFKYTDFVSWKQNFQNRFWFKFW